MEEYKGENKIVLRGQAAGAPALSHHNHGVDYYLVPLRVPRLSGTDDVLNVLTADPDPAVCRRGCGRRSRGRCGPTTTARGRGASW